MTIRNSDGSVYKLRGPNKLTTLHQRWDYSKVEFINFGWEDSSLTNKETIRNKPFYNSSWEIIEVSKSSFTHSSDLKINISGSCAIGNQKPTLPEELRKHKKVFLCQETSAVSRQDTLYGTSYRETIYGSTFSLEGIIFEYSDLNMSFWGTKEVKIGTVLFPKDGNKRWWKSIRCYSKSGGFVIECIPSDYSPDLSEI